MSEFVIVTSTAKTKWRNCHNVAVVEVEDGAEPKMISTRARGVIRIVRKWPRCYLGRTDRCQYARAMDDAKKLISELSHGHSQHR